MNYSRCFVGLGVGGLAIATGRQLAHVVGAQVANGSHRLAIWVMWRSSCRPPDQFLVMCTE